MKRKEDAFRSCHPFVGLMYFICVIGFAMAFTNPVCLGISFIGAFIYSVVLRGRQGIKKNLIYMIPLIILTAIINPAFSHQGVTILTYLPSGNPLTLESILYGVMAAFMLVTVICWFVCVNEVMTSDKMVYLFGRLIPVLSLMLSMTLKFVPEFTKKLSEVYRAQKAAGFTCKGKYFKRIRTGIRVLSTTITWSLERGIVTADSMKSRGYGLSGRTAYSIFRFDTRDRNCLIFMITAGVYILVGAMKGAFTFYYYPNISAILPGAYTISLFLVYGLLIFLPVFLHLAEKRQLQKKLSRQLIGNKLEI